MNWDGVQPSLVRSGHLRVDDPRHPGGKYYLPAFTYRGVTRFGVRKFQTASLAVLRAAWTVERWIRMRKTAEVQA